MMRKCCQFIFNRVRSVEMYFRWVNSSDGTRHLIYGAKERRTVWRPAPKFDELLDRFDQYRATIVPNGDKFQPPAGALADAVLGPANTTGIQHEYRSVVASDLAGVVAEVDDAVAHDHRVTIAAWGIARPSAQWTWQQVDMARSRMHLQRPDSSLRLSKDARCFESMLPKPRERQILVCK